jgi:hypothetical protein
MRLAWWSSGFKRSMLRVLRAGVPTLFPLLAEVRCGYLFGDRGVQIGSTVSGDGRFGLPVRMTINGAFRACSSGPLFWPYSRTTLGVF